MEKDSLLKVYMRTSQKCCNHPAIFELWPDLFSILDFRSRGLRLHDVPYSLWTCETYNAAYCLRRSVYIRMHQNSLLSDCFLSWSFLLGGDITPDTGLDRELLKFRDDLKLELPLP